MDYMKNDIHPNYFKEAKITCACGAKFNVGSTMEAIHVEICSQCHPFYTGKEKLLDTAGRVDKFRARMAAAEQHKKSETLKNEQMKKLEKAQKDENEKEKAESK